MSSGIVGIIAFLLGAYLMDRIRSRVPHSHFDQKVDREVSEELKRIEDADQGRRNEIEEAKDRVNSLSDTELAGEFDRVFSAMPDVNGDDGGSNSTVRRDSSSN